MFQSIPEYSRGEVDDFQKIRFIESYIQGENFDKLSELLYSKLLKEKKVKRWSQKDGKKERYLYNIKNTHKDEYIELFKSIYSFYFVDFAQLYEEKGEKWNGNSWRVNPTTGNWEEYSSYNPNSKWDWYDEDGRWSGAIKKKGGAYVNQCLLGDIDWTDFKPEDYEDKETTDFWGKKYKPLKESVKWHFTKSSLPFCFVIDGEWMEKGEMGWFGISSNEMSEEDWNKKMNEILTGLPEDCWVFNIDFHI